MQLLKLQIGKSSLLRGVQLFLLIQFLCTSTLFSQKERSFSSTEIIYTALEMHDELVRSDIGKLKDLLSIIDREEVRKNPFARAAYHRILGTYQMKAEKPEGAIANYKEALRFFIQNQDFSLSSQIACDAGNACQLMGAFDSAKKYYHLSLDLGKESHDENDSYNAYYGLARLNLLEGDTTYAQALLNSYIHRAKTNKKHEAVSDAYSTLFTISDARQEFDLAKEQLQRATIYADRSQSKLHRSNVNVNQGIIAFTEGRTEEAMLFFHSALILRKELNTNRLVCDAFYNLGAGHLFMSNMDSALFYFEASRNLAVTYDLFPDARDALNALIQTTNHDVSKKSLEEELVFINALIEEKRKERFFDSELPTLFREDKESAYKSFGVTPQFLLIIGVAVVLSLSLLWREKKGY